MRIQYDWTASPNAVGAMCARVNSGGVLGSEVAKNGMGTVFQCQGYHVDAFAAIIPAKATAQHGMFYLFSVNEHFMMVLYVF